MMASNNRINLLVDCLLCSKNRAGRDPRILKCKHGFCYNCLATASGILFMNYVQCPVCWEKTYLLGQGLASLPADKQVCDAVKSLAGCKELTFCKTCQVKGKTSTASSRCDTCDRMLCENCANKHVERKPLSNHLIVRKMCKIHISDYSHACLTCLSGICIDCIESELHDDHDVCEITEISSKASGVLFEGRAKLQNKIVELQDLIKKITAKASAALNDRRKEIIDNLTSCQTKLKEDFEKSLNDRDRIYIDSMNLAHEGKNKACQEGYETVNSIEQLTGEKDLNIITNFLTKSEEIYTTINHLTYALSLPDSCPQLGADTCVLNEDESDGELEFRCIIGPVIPGHPVDYTADPIRILQLSTIEGRSIVHLWFLKPGPGATLIIGDASKPEALRISTNGHVLEKYRTADGKNVSGAAVSNNTIYIISASGKTVAAHTESMVHVIKLRPGVEDPWDMDTDGQSLMMVNYQTKLLRYSYQGELIQEIDSPGIYNITCGVHPEIGSVYLITDLENQLVRLLSKNGDHIQTVGSTGQGQGQYVFPAGSAMLPNGNIIVADSKSQRILEFQSDGTFIRDLLTDNEGLSQPSFVCISPPYLCVGSYKELHFFSFPIMYNTLSIPKMQATHISAVE